MSTAPRRLHLIRHASVAPGRRGCMIGRTDEPLDELGRDEARSLGRLTPLTKPPEDVAVFVSPLQRAAQTAELALPAWVHQRMSVLADLREVDFGRWEGLTFAQIAQREPREVDRWASLGAGFTFPEGESFEAFVQRVQAVTDRLRQEEARTTLVFAHGGVIRVMLCLLLGLAPAEHHLGFAVEPASLSGVDLFKPSGAVLRRLNVTAGLWAGGDG